MNLLKKFIASTLLISSLAFGQGTVEPRQLKRGGAAVGGSLVWDGVKWNPQDVTNYVSTTFNFSKTKNAGVTGDLSVPGNNILTFSRCPMGVNGADSHHYVYVSGGTGTAEASLIVGGTCVAGSAGTLTISTANAHTGTWTVASATAGIQEALNTAPSSGSTISIPTGIHTTYAPVYISLEGARITCSTRNHASAMVMNTSTVLFDVEAGSVEIAGCALRGGANPTTGAPAPSGNIGILANGVRGHFHDLHIDQIWGGIETASGFHHKITNVWGRNVSAYLIKHSGGVSPFIDTVTYATDLPFEVPSEAGIVINASGAYIYNIDILVAYNGILIEPTDEEVTWTFIYDARLDQNWHAGVVIKNNSIHQVRGVFIHDLWSATAGVGLAELFTSGGSSLGANDGIGLIIGEGSAGNIHEVVVDGGEIHNNRYQNIKIFAGSDVVKLMNLRLLEANAGNAAAGTVDNVYVQTDGRVEIAECEIRGALSGANDMRSGVLAAPVAVNITTWDNTFSGTFTSGSPIHDLSTNSGVRVFGFNRGVDDTAQTLASATTVSTPPTKYVHITGTTPVSNLLPAYHGRKMFIYKPDSGTLDFNTDGNIQSPTGTPGVVFSLHAGETAVCEFAGQKWLCHK